MSPSNDRRIGVAVTAAVVALVVAAGLWVPGALDDGEPSPSAAPTMVGEAPTAAPTISAPAFELVMELGSLSGRGPRGPVEAQRLTGQAQSVLNTMTEIYSTAFVDPARWEGGRFPSLFRLFDPAVRRSVARDLDELTLGPAASLLDAVRPLRAIMDLEFLTDAGRHPVTAFAHVEFGGVGIGPDGPVRVRHDGEYVLRRAGGRWRIAAYDVRSRVPRPAEDRAGLRGATIWPGLPAGDPFFVLVIGSDARPGQTVARTRADSLHIVGVNPRRRIASIVGIPRDSYVPIPGAGVDKINAALARGGPALVLETVERLAGIHIDAYVLTGFAGFERLIRGVGGVDVRIPYAISDRFSHAQFDPGWTKLNGRQALAFARNRNDAPGGDFGRSLNQGRLILAALGELRRDLRRSELALVPWVLAGARYLQTEMTFPQMMDLLLSVPSIPPSRVRNVVVPGGTGSVGGRSVVFLGAGATAIFRDLAGDAVLGR